MKEQEQNLETGVVIQPPESDNIITIQTPMSEEPVTSTGIIENMPQETEQQNNDDIDKQEKNKRRWTQKKELYELNHEKNTEIQNLRNQLDSMQNLLYESVDRGSFHYENQLKNSLTGAKNAYSSALEDGDSKAAADAIEAINAIGFELSKFQGIKQNLKAPEPSNEEVNNRNQAYDEERIRGLKQQRIELMHDWIQDNPQLIPKSPQYDKAFAQDILGYIKKIDSKLHAKQMSEYIGTPQYLQLLDEYIDNVKYNKNKSFSSVGKVHNRSYGATTNAVINLTPEQKKAAAAFNMSEEKYANYLKKYAQEAKR